jgi:probable HAF family extracellular repeat protein
MKSRKLMCITAITLFALLAIPYRLAAQEPSVPQPKQQTHEHHHYKLIDLGTFGGPNTYYWGLGSQNLNNRGMVTGSADTSIPDPNAPNCFNPDCLVSHALQWQKGVLTDLGALPGVNSSFGSWISPNGLIAGMSLNGTINPITGFPESRAVFWKGGGPIDLGTFGGNESYANAVNNRGEVVGSAANAIPDPFNTAPFLYGWGTQMHAFLWEDGVKHDLGTLGGPDSLAYYVNDAHQVAGFSYTSYMPNPLTGVPPGHPFLWENGKMHDLGTIGGTQVFDLDGLNERGQVIGEMTLADEVKTHPFFWDGKNLVDLGTFGGDHGNANELNDAGEVVGYADYPIAFGSCPGGGQIAHAYLWRNGVKTDLGTVPGINPRKGGSFAWGINSKTQIVGNSATCDYSVFDAFLWENGSMADLNTLVPPDSALHLFWAVYISDRGEITGFGTLPNGDVHTALLIPCEGDDDGCQGENPTGLTQNNPTPAAQLPARDTGVIPGPNATLSPTSLTFATQLLHNTSAAQTVTLANNGNRTLRINRIVITGQDRGDFAQTNTCGSRVPPGGSCNIMVTFNPTAINTRSARLSVFDNAPGSPQIASLTGTGTTVFLNPASLYFGIVRLGGFKTLTTVLTNVGSTMLSITSITLSQKGGFYESNNCGSGVGAGQSCTITVHFYPRTVGRIVGTVSIYDNGGGSPQTVPLVGYGE